VTSKLRQKILLKIDEAKCHGLGCRWTCGPESWTGLQVGQKASRGREIKEQRNAGTGHRTEQRLEALAFFLLRLLREPIPVLALPSPVPLILLQTIPKLYQFVLSTSNPL
jgi:hypothetical protein